MARNIKIGLAEDHDLVRQGMVALLKDEPNIKIVFDVANGSELLEILKTKTIDVLLLDLDMPIIDGVEALRVIRDRYSKLKVIIVSMYYQNEFITECIAEGAKGFLPKNCDIEKVVDAIFAVHEKEFYFDEKVSHALVSEILHKSQNDYKGNANPLTMREVDIIKMVCKGFKNKDIAKELCLSPRTIEGHRQNIFDKTRTSSTVELVVYAIKSGIYKVNG